MSLVFKLFGYVGLESRTRSYRQADTCRHAGPARGREETAKQEGREKEDQDPTREPTAIVADVSSLRAKCPIPLLGIGSSRSLLAE